MAIRSGLAIAVATIGILGLGFTSTAAAQGACTGGGKISKQIAKPMTAAQDAQKARKWQEVLTRTREAESTPGAKSQFDLYWMAEFRGYAYHNLRQNAEAARELEAALNNPCMPEAQQARALQEPRGPVRLAEKPCQGHRVRQPRAQGCARSRHAGRRGAGLLPVRQQQGSRAHDERAAREQRRCAEGTAAAAGRVGLPEGRQQRLRQQCVRKAGGALPEARVLAAADSGPEGRGHRRICRRSMSCASRCT